MFGRLWGPQKGGTHRPENAGYYVSYYDSSANFLTCEGLFMARCVHLVQRVVDVSYRTNLFHGKCLYINVRKFM